MFRKKKSQQEQVKLLKAKNKDYIKMSGRDLTNSGPCFIVLEKEGRLL